MPKTEKNKTLALTVTHLAVSFLTVKSFFRTLTVKKNEQTVFLKETQEK